MLTFQQIILKLQDYWDQQGCALLQPIDLEVGAGTSHTATFLRAIGPEPWKQLMFNHHADQKMVAMVKIQIAYNTITNIKSFLSRPLKIFWSSI